MMGIAVMSDIFRVLVLGIEHHILLPLRLTAWLPLRSNCKLGFSCDLLLLSMPNRRHAAGEEVGLSQL